MGNNTKIFVFKGKELIYTILFIALAAILILLLLYMFKSKHTESTASNDKYTPGVYTSSVTIGDSSLNVTVTVDKNCITSVEVDNLDETITTMYPLLEPAIDEINSQISTADSIDDINYSSENQYTYIILNQAIKNSYYKSRKQAIKKGV